MGIVSKFWKGIKKPFKAVGKAIKSVFKSVGKFMNKIGVVGQIGLLLAMPYIGAAMGSLWTSVAGQTAAQASAAAGAAVSAGTATAAQAAIVAGSSAATASGLMAGGSFAQAVGGLMNSVGSFAARASAGVGKTWDSITKGVSSFIGEFSKTAATKLGFSVEGASANFFGPNSAWSKTTTAFAKPWQPVAKVASLIPGPLEGAAPGTFSKAQISAATEQIEGTLLPGGYSPVPKPDFTSQFTKPVNVDYSPVAKPLSSSSVAGSASAAGSKVAATGAAKTSILANIKKDIGAEIAKAGSVSPANVSRAIVATAGQYAFSDDIAGDDRRASAEAPTIYEMFSLEDFGTYKPTTMASQTPIGPLQYASSYDSDYPLSTWAQQFAVFQNQQGART